MNKKVRQKVFDKYDGKYVYCGVNLSKGWHVDHINPIKRDSEWNSSKRKFEQKGTCGNPEMMS